MRQEEESQAGKCCSLRLSKRGSHMQKQAGAGGTGGNREREFWGMWWEGGDFRWWWFLEVGGW